MFAADLAPVGGNAADTWGISGPTFLALYAAGGLAVAALAGYLVRRRSRPGDDAIATDELSPVQLGLLSGRDTLAVTVALADLRRLGLLNDAGRLTSPVDPAGRPVLHKPAALLDPVSRAVYDSLGSSPDTRQGPTALTKRAAVVAALASETRRLEAAGLLTTPPVRAGAVAARLLVGGFIALGVLRIVAGLAGHAPVEFLVALVAIAATLLLRLVSRVGGQRLTGDGRHALQDLRKTNLHLSPEFNPSWTTYGVGSVVLATALFGGAVMFAADPVFADAASIVDMDVVSEPTWFSGWSPSSWFSGNWDGGWGGNSWSGCGGGSSCGSGSSSSCGGGGGCGG